MTIPPEPRTAADVASYVLSILASSAHTPYIGEPVSQLEHSLQCAALAAAAADPPADETTQVAALLHDIGQFAPEEDLADLLSAASASASAAAGGEFAGVQHMGSSAAQSVGRVGHEDIGARYLLVLGFPEKVARLVAAHVPAKRYLCAVDEGYHARLSDASKKSLEFQGGPMSESEQRDFESSPWCRDMCRLRRWDDEAKVVGLQVPGLESWSGAVERVLQGNV